MTAPEGRALVTVGAGLEQVESAALINPLACPDDVPDHRTFDLADADTARAALRDAGFGSVATADVAFSMEFETEDGAVAAQLPAGPVAAAVRHSGRSAVEAAVRSFFSSRSCADGTVRMDVVFRCCCCIAQRAS